MAKRRGISASGKNPQVIYLTYENPLRGFPALNDAVIHAMGEQELFELVSFGQVTSGRCAGSFFGSLPMPEMRTLLEALLRGQGIDIHLIHRPPVSLDPTSHRLYLKGGRLISVPRKSRDIASAGFRGPIGLQYVDTAAHPRQSCPPQIGKPPADLRPTQPRFAPGERPVYARLLWLAALSQFLQRSAQPVEISTGLSSIGVTMGPLNLMYTAEVRPWGTKIQSLLDIWHEGFGKVLSICSAPLGPPESWRRSEVGMFSFYADPVEIVCFKPGAWMELLLQRQIAPPS